MISDFCDEKCINCGHLGFTNRKEILFKIVSDKEETHWFWDCEYCGKENDLLVGGSHDSSIDI